MLKEPKEWWQESYEARMERREARRATPEYQARIAAIARRRRYLEIWSEILEEERRRQLPFWVQVRIAPRIRGCGHAARKAGF
jgi:hypothetical protein